jgi:hypothetical protein
MVTLLTESGEHALTGAEPSRAALWCEPDEALAATGWAVKPEGLCRGPVCVPLPAGRERELVAGGRIDLAALWRHLGRPLAHSERGDVWVLGESARERTAALVSLEAPDFALPDPEGRVHRLSDHRGKKVLLVTWASW